MKSNNTSSIEINLKNAIYAIKQGDLNQAEFDYYIQSLNEESRGTLLLYLAVYKRIETLCFFETDTPRLSVKPIDDWMKNQLVAHDFPRFNQILKESIDSNSLYVFSVLNRFYPGIVMPVQTALEGLPIHISMKIDHVSDFSPDIKKQISEINALIENIQMIINAIQSNNVAFIRQHLVDATDRSLLTSRDVSAGSTDRASAVDTVEELQPLLFDYPNDLKAYLVLFAIEHQKNEVVQLLSRNESFIKSLLSKPLDFSSVCIKYHLQTIQPLHELMLKVIASDNHAMLQSLEPYHLDKFFNPEQQLKMVTLAVRKNNLSALTWLKEKLNCVLEKNDYDWIKEQTKRVSYPELVGEGQMCGGRWETMYRDEITPAKQTNVGYGSALLVAADEEKTAVMDWLLSQRFNQKISQCERVINMAESRRVLSDYLNNRDLNTVSGDELIATIRQVPGKLLECTHAAIRFFNEGIQTAVFKINLSSVKYKDWDDIFKRFLSDPKENEKTGELIDYFIQNTKLIEGHREFAMLFRSTVSMRSALDRIKSGQALTSDDQRILSSKRDYKDIALHEIIHVDRLDLFKTIGKPDDINQDNLIIIAKHDAIDLFEYIFNRKPAFMSSSAVWDKLKRLSHDGHHPKLSEFLSKYLVNPHCTQPEHWRLFCSSFEQIRIRTPDGKVRAGLFFFTSGDESDGQNDGHTDTYSQVIHRPNN